MSWLSFNDIYHIGDLTPPSQKQTNQPKKIKQDIFFLQKYKQIKFEWHDLRYILIKEKL